MTATRKPARAALGDLMLLQREVNQLFERLSLYERVDRPATGDWNPGVDVYERDDAVVVVIEVPGLAPDALKVTFHGDQLTVSGERRERRLGSSIAAFLCLERPRGRFRRTIPLELALDVRQAEAQLDTGLLTITIPRVRDRRGRETVIPVHRERA